MFPHSNLVQGRNLKAWRAHFTFAPDGQAGICEGLLEILLEDVSWSALASTVMLLQALLCMPGCWELSALKDLSGEGQVTG